MLEPRKLARWREKRDPAASVAAIARKSQRLQECTGVEREKEGEREEKAGENRISGGKKEKERRDHVERRGVASPPKSVARSRGESETEQPVDNGPPARAV